MQAFRFLAGFFFAASSTCIAGQTSGSFDVVVNLEKTDSCTSAALSEQTDALVKVVCATGQFVSISPAPGKPFLGTHGGAFRYNFRTNSASSLGNIGAESFYPGMGTVTGLRIYNANGPDGQFEMLVSF